MRKMILVVVILGCLSFVYASDISRLDFSELPRLSEYVVLGHVEKVIRTDEFSDTIRIRIVKILKGMFHPPGTMEIVLRNKGVKDFDPILKVGDKGVFFLSKVEGTTGTLAYWGSIAIFPKDNFDTVDKSGSGDGK